MSHRYFNTTTKREQPKQERYTTCGSVCTNNTTTTYKTNRNETSKLLTETDGKRTEKRRQTGSTRAAHGQHTGSTRAAHGQHTGGEPTDRKTTSRETISTILSQVETETRKNSFVQGNDYKRSISIVKETNIVNRRHETHGQSDQTNTTEIAKKKTKKDEQDNEQTTNNKRKDDNYITLQKSKRLIRSQQNDKLQTGRSKKTTKHRPRRRHMTSRTLSITIIDSIDGQRDEWFDVPLAALFFARLVEQPVARNVERGGEESVASTDAHCSAEQASKPLERSCLQLSTTSGEQPCEQVPARQSEPDRAV